jgi:hypothetical protein
MTSAITILVGAVFGDLIVKRNVEAFNAEQAAFAAAPKDGDAAFSAARAVYDARLRERRRQTQRIIKYIADDSVAAFDAFYPVYEAALSDWNNNHDAMAAKILSATGCEDQFPKARQAEREAFFGSQFERVQTHPGFDQFRNAEPGKAKEAWDKLLKEGRFCPTFFLTKRTGYSVHSAFLSMHNRIYNYRAHDFNECRLRHRRNIADYYKSCLAAESPDERTNCMRQFDRTIEDGGFCSRGDFDLNSFKVRDFEFNEFDFYWALGDRFFKAFRRDFLLDYCEKRIGFWGTLLGRSCEAPVDAYLKTH